MQLPAFETKRLQLRAATNSDLDDVYAIYSNPDVIRYTGDIPWTNMCWVYCEENGYRANTLYRKTDNQL
jgi:RimJ/RimL family protein N-acetyltransferase